MELNHRWHSLKKYWWLIGMGTLFGATLVIDPYLRHIYYTEIQEIRMLKIVIRFPYFVNILILVVPIIFTLIYKGFKSLTRLQRDQFYIIALISTIFINYYGLIRIHVGMLLLIIGSAIFLTRGALKGRIDIVKLPIDTYFFVLMLFMLISSYGPLGRGSTNIETLTFFVGLYLPIVLIHNIIRTRRQLIKSIHYMVYFTICMSIIGIMQYVIYKSIGLDVTGTWNQILGRRATLPIFGTFVRVGGLTGNSNYLAQSTGTLTVMMAFLSFRGTYFSKRWRMIFLLGIFLGLWCSWFSVSRGSWLSLSICSIVILLMAYPQHIKRILWVLILIGLFGLFSGLFEYMFDQVSGIREESIDYRERLLVMGLNTIRENPWIGVGYGAFEDYWNIHDAEVHNLWLNFATQLGVLGASVVVIYILSLWFRLIRSILRSRGFNRIILQSFLLGLLFLFVNTMVRPLLHHKFFWIYLGFIETAIYILGRWELSSKVYYPIFGYSWRDEPLIQLDRGS